MAGYLGYALQAGVQGFQSGFNMGQSKTEMEWQKKQQKKLEEQELKLETEAASYNMVVKQLGADGFYSEDDMMKINTSYLALGYLTQERIKGSHDAIMSMDEKAFNREMEWFNSTTELLGSGLLDPKDATALLEYGRDNWATSEKIQNLYTAYDNIYAKTHGKMQKEKAWERLPSIPDPYRVPYLEEQGIEMPEPEVTPETEADLSVAERKYNFAIEHYNLPEGDPNKISFEQLSRFMGITDITPEKATGLKKTIQDIQTQGAAAGISQEEINTAVKNEILGKPTSTTPTSFKTLQDIKDLFKNVKDRASYDEAIATWNASKEAKISDWTPPEFGNQLTDLIKRVESAFWADFVNKAGKLKDKEESELYNKRVQQYLLLIEEARNAGVDVSQFQAFIPYKELYWGRGNPLVTSESW